MIKVLFWVFVGLVTYVYLGYPLSLIALNRLRPAASAQGSLPEAETTPTVSLIVAAYNEEKAIAQKIKNALALDYPHDRLEAIVASDGSTDRTNEVVRSYAGQGIKLAALEVNQGKSSAQNTAIAQARGEILFFSDANVMLRPDAMRRVIGHFADPRVGCVVGQVTYLNEGETSVSEGEGFYWHYELFLRAQESALGNFAMGSGPIMAVRRSLARPLDPDVGEDFVLPMQTAIQGYRVLYDPQAISEEILTQSEPRSMFRSKVRIVSKDLRGLFSCGQILNPFRYPLYAWGLVSHKLLRWLVPYFLIALLALNVLLVGYSPRSTPFYRLTLALQLAFYAAALLGYLWQRRSKSPRLLGIPFSFSLVNTAALVGVAQFVLGKRSGRWTPVR